MADERQALAAEPVTDAGEYRLKDMCEMCGTNAEYVVELVEAGIIDVHGDTPAVWLFSSAAVMRSRKALRLQRDLEINMPGIAVALALLDEMETLRTHVRSLTQQLEKLQR